MHLEIKRMGGGIVLFCRTTQNIESRPGVMNEGRAQVTPQNHRLRRMNAGQQCCGEQRPLYTTTDHFDRGRKPSYPGPPQKRERLSGLPATSEGHNMILFYAEIQSAANK